MIGSSRLPLFHYINPLTGVIILLRDSVCLIAFYTYLSVFWTKNPATMPMVVGKLAAHTPSRFSVFSSILLATTKGGAHAKHAVSPGTRNWIWPDTAFSETPLSNQVWPSSLQALLMAIRASKLSTQLKTKLTGWPSFNEPWLILKSCRDYDY